MQIDDVKRIVAVVWLSAAWAAGLLAQITSASAWLILTACAAVPLLVMARLWKHPQPSMSESIRDVLR